MPLTLLLTVWGSADWAIYTDGSFTKTEFRRAAKYVTDWWRPDETVILLSGHMSPVWDYYRPAGPRVRIPDIDTLDTGRTVDYSVADQLNQALAGKGGVWVVQWQDDAVDPSGLVINMLSQVAGLEPMDLGFVRSDAERSNARPAQFQQVVLTHFRLRPDQSFTFSAQPPIQHPAEVTFGQQVQLLGWSQEAQNGHNDLVLFWKALQPLTQTYKMQLTLRSTEGQVLASMPDRRLAAYEYPTNRWPTGQVVFGRVPLDSLSGQRTGAYGLGILVYAEDDPQSKPLPLANAGTPVTILQPVQLGRP